jgi:DNA-directed RNA polymerase subunit RPC12/RpoP
MLKKMLKQISQNEAITIVNKLRAIFVPEVPPQTILFKPDNEMQEHGYIAFCIPEQNVIVFRENYIPLDAPFHEFMHVYFYRLTGDRGSHTTSEGFAQMFAAGLSYIDQESIFSFVCINCYRTPTKLTILKDGDFACAYCGQRYGIKLY